jgi:nucleolar protein 14
MAPSQLKQLKASLKESGVLGPQQSKKQRKTNSKDAQKRLQRNTALEGIREKFNPFEVKAPARRQKHEVFTNQEAKSSVGRPGVTRGLGEERRRETLLRELQSRNKVGGMHDKRFGENDPTLTPEERAAERFARQNERKLRKTALFNLEVESEEEMALTHGGRSLDFGEGVDDYKKDEMDEGSADDFDEQNDRPRKRVRLDGEDTDPEEDQTPGRKKTKNEVMKEVIAKSKMYKAERQAAKEDDDDIRLQLDKGMGDLYEAMRNHKQPERPLPTPPSDTEPQMDPARAAMLAGKSREDAEKEYEANIRQMKMDARSKPTFRTKTEEEKAAEEADRLQELEKKRLKRMRGEEGSSDEEEPEEPSAEDEEHDDAEAFGLSAPQVEDRPQLDVEDEDEFVLDDLVASGSDIDPASDDEDSASHGGDMEDDGDDDFINGLVLPKTTLRKPIAANKDLAYTYPCPQTHAELLDVLEGTRAEDVPIIIQRVRALYHKGLAQGNQEKLGNFARVLVEHIPYTVDHEDFHALAVESLLRHVHSMAKSQPQEVAGAFRGHLLAISEDRPLALTAGDVMLLTGASTIFPASDHFHTVVTPAMFTIGRYLGQSSVQTVQDLGVGAYCCSLALDYQQLAKRYIPEVVTYIVNAMAVLSPTQMPETLSLKGYGGKPLAIPVRLPDTPLRIQAGLKDQAAPKASFKTVVHSPSSKQGLALLHLFIQLAVTASDLWSAKSAHPEINLTLIHAVSHLTTTSLPSTTLQHARSTLDHLLNSHASSIKARRPLLLHNHRPLAIKTALPQFTESYNPNRHYDPDVQRAQLSKLKAEHKKERKGAMRELRKDANFIAREQLREKKEKDEAYDKKFKRLVAEIQGEEGREAKEYEREKKRRKGKF